MKQMFSLSSLPPTIPVFPLGGVLLLPRARLPLNIFEPRYLAMLDDALKSDHRIIGMIQPWENSPKGGDQELHDIGCAGRVTSFSESEDGRYMITLSGVSRFRITEQVAGFSPYIKCDVDWSDFQRDLGRTEVDEDFNRPEFLKILARFFEASKLSTDWGNLKEADEELLVNSLSMLCPFSAEEKQALMEASSLSNRREILVTLMEFALRGSRDEEKMQ